jgi:hypothetical protein
VLLQIAEICSSELLTGATGIGQVACIRLKLKQPSKNIK